VKEFIRKPVGLEELKANIEFALGLKGSSGEDQKPLSLYVSDVRNPGCCIERDDLPGNILNVVRFIEENLVDDISLETLAREASLSKCYFCKMFKKHFGMAPLKYVAAKRVEMAKRLLPKKDRNVSFVAYEVGFRDVSSFNKHFKRQTGVTPSLFRSAARKQEV
jgi:AraC-like DNA-binding protein